MNSKLQQPDLCRSVGNCPGIVPALSQGFNALVTSTLGYSQPPACPREEGNCPVTGKAGKGGEHEGKGSASKVTDGVSGSELSSEPAGLAGFL